VSENPKKLYIKMTVATDQDEVTVTVEDSYTGITSVVLNQQVLFNRTPEGLTEPEACLIISFLLRAS
jgi:hypothetical protein